MKSYLTVPSWRVLKLCEKVIDLAKQEISSIDEREQKHIERYNNLSWWKKQFATNPEFSKMYYHALRYDQEGIIHSARALISAANEPTAKEINIDVETWYELMGTLDEQDFVNYEEG